MSALKPFAIEVIYRNVKPGWGDKWMLYKRYICEERRDQALEQLQQNHQGTGIEFRKGE